MLLIKAFLLPFQLMFLFCGMLRKGKRRCQQFIHPFINFLLCNPSFFQRPDQLSSTVKATARHLQVGTIPDALRKIIAAAPVRDHEPFKSPLLPEDLLQQKRIFIGIGAVHFIVG